MGGKTKVKISPNCVKNERGGRDNWAMPKLKACFFLGRRPPDTFDFRVLNNDFVIPTPTQFLNKFRKCNPEIDDSF